MKDTMQEKEVEAPTAKREGKGAGLIVGVVAAVIVAAGAGFWIWHEQPSFCATMCHDTMGSYLESYES